MKATAQQSNPIWQTEAEIRAQNTNWSLAYNNTVVNRFWAPLPGEDLSCLPLGHFPQVYLDN